MKRMLNVLAFVIVTVLVASWDCGNIEFKELLFYSGIVISVLINAHFCRFLLIFFHSSKNAHKSRLA